MAARDSRATGGSLRASEAPPQTAADVPRPRATRKSRDQYLAILAKLRALLADRQTLAACAAALDVPLSTLHDMARRHDLPRRRRSLPAATRRNLELLVRKGEKSITEIAHLLGLAKSTVSDERRRQLDRGFAFRPRKRRAPVRCPQHGLVHLWPCIACAAEAAKVKPPP
jgi:DNA-binding CsgD family transcriptional regulator